MMTACVVKGITDKKRAQLLKRYTEELSPHIDTPVWEGECQACGRRLGRFEGYGNQCVTQDCWMKGVRV
jgi:hypothetical protein